MAVPTESQLNNVILTPAQHPLDPLTPEEIGEATAILKTQRNLGAEAVDVIYRFRGHDIYYNLEDCLFLVSEWEPELFSPRGVGHLKQLASNEARRYVDRTLPDQSSFHGWHSVKSSTNISIVRNSRHIPTGRSPFWVQLYNFDQNRGGGNLDTLMSQWV